MFRQIAAIVRDLRAVKQADRQRLLSERQKLAELLEQSDQLLHFSKSQQAQAERQQQDLLRMTERLVKAQEQRKLEYVEAQGQELSKAIEQQVVAGMTEKLQQQFDEASRLVEEHAHKNAGADIAEAMQQLRAVRKASKLQRDEDQ